jgi:hypothetical protein
MEDKRARGRGGKSGTRESKKKVTPSVIYMRIESSLRQRNKRGEKRK